jgi:16S rRNA (guanine(966)-N(2))-methyltransferase RsmD
MEVAKEGLFNTLAAMMDLEGIRTLEIFGGTGSISYELASRGAADLTIVERDAPTIGFIKKTVEELGVAEQFHITRADVFKFLNQCAEQFDLIFADPPYALDMMNDLPDIIFARNLLLPGGTFILEHTSRNDFRGHANFLRTKNYGTTVFSFFTKAKN